MLVLAWALPPQLMAETGGKASTTLHRDEPFDSKINLYNTLTTLLKLDLNTFKSFNQSNPPQAFLQTKFNSTTFCPATVASKTNCGQRPPLFNQTGEFGTRNPDFFQLSLAEVRRDKAPEVWNLAQILYFIGRVDLGIDSASNFLTQTEAIPMVLANPPGSTLYTEMEILASAPGIIIGHGRYPLTISGLSTIPGE
ncbi:hypothetical protein CPB83DRAFT_844474 [Crepidotus variabilis]|uniref:Uncharacterized protein n=1 Tax=Crepidotus variabilis TaxID=179855 RepID=A0A9P6JVS8_9AGAR|nr:hypothetical protein CPB83DRAFT_844474 [Crepidotus variabilis]